VRQQHTHFNTCISLSSSLERVLIRDFPKLSYSFSELFPIYIALILKRNLHSVEPLLALHLPFRCKSIFDVQHVVRKPYIPFVSKILYIRFHSFFSLGLAPFIMFLHTLLASASLPVAFAKVQFLGVAIAGGDFGCQIDGTCPTSSVQFAGDAADQMNHFVGEGMNLMRIRESWAYLN
jgi:hypothetical protein